MRSSPISSLAVAWLAVGLSIVCGMLAAALWAWHSASQLDGGPSLNLARCSPRAIVGRLETVGKESWSVKPDSRGRGFFLCDLRVPAGRLSTLRYAIDGPTGFDAVLVWERAADPGAVFHLPLPEDGIAVNLSSTGNWSGTITRIGILISTVGGGEPAPGLQSGRVSGKTVLAAESPANRLAELWTRFYAYRGWTGRSINHLGWTILPVLLLGWIILTVLIALALPSASRRRSAVLAGAFAFAVAWLALEGLWLSQLLRQVRHTHDRFASVEPAALPSRSTDWELAELCGAVRSLASGDERVLIVSNVRYAGEKARYMLLPLPAAHIRNLKQLPGAMRALRIGDFIAAVNVDSAAIQRALQPLGIRTTIAWSREHRAILRITNMPGRPESDSSSQPDGTGERPGTNS